MQEPKPTRFVILHHTQSDGEHWDLMLEEGEVLLTWRLSADPTVSGSNRIAAERVADHRPAYLTYEGELSGGRGFVRRIESGAWERIKSGHSPKEIRFFGSFLNGDYRLEPILGVDWVFQRIVDRKH